MKRLLFFICTLLCANVLFAQTTFWVGELQYKVINSTTNQVEVYDASTSITTVDIPTTVTYYGNTTYSVTSIRDYAFSNCSSLTSVTIPYSITSIGNSAFSNCSSLTTIHYNAINCEDFSYYYHQFENCPISAINIGDSVQRIPGYFASNCDSLTSVTLPENITYIGYEAFYNAGVDASVIIDSVTYKVSPVTIPESYYANLTDDSYTISDYGLITFHIGDSTYAPTEAMVYDCEQSRSGNVDILSSIEFVGNTYPITSIGNSAFSGCDNLSSVTIPNSITSIGNSAFSSCDNLSSVTIPNSVTSIGNSAFSGCSGLSSITIPNSVTSIGNRTFFGCSSLTSITIPNSVTTIEKEAFERCSSLTLLNIGNSVNYIGEYAFSDCNFLLNINCLAENPPAIFNNTSFPYPNSAILTVPCGSLEAYSNHANLWNVFFNNRIYENGFDVNVSLNNTLAGHVEIESNCEMAVLTAIANSGYRFVNWSDGHTENPRIIELQGDTTLIANFDIIISGAELSATICEGASLNFGGINITNSGVYTQTFTAVNGTDSIVTLTVTVNPSYNIVIDTVLNEGDVYTENGFNESEIGTYVQYFQTIEGCDSIITLNILSNVSLLDVEYEEISFFPNPTKSEITFSQAIEKVEVIDLTGKAIFTFTNAKTINIESLPAGAYYLRLTNEEKTSLQKVIKQ